MSSRDEIAQLDPKARVFHLTAYPTALALLGLINRCPKLDAVQVPPSQFHKVSKPSRCLLEIQGVRIFPGVIQGHRTDKDAYYTVDDNQILQRAGELQAVGLDPEEIVVKVAREVEVSPGLAAFILAP